ncbi:DUF4325 domain-containing protein [Empedobacter sp. R132-2]|uniref:STAS-like domain-containing protein n=1 Tax=Empedobacter sp. R132-2 TaxID=2746740 RepID=UPI002575ECB9|nr:DUF4325 domain-containing protein [Empedobacter sp. R132-2]MDM1137815.1 DUF4325 domain-containing protein [Empedobacter sp. R132-2]
MKINILDIINSNLATNIEDGVNVFNVISDINPDSLILSFEGIKRISTAFLNESIGQYALIHNNVNTNNFVFPEDKPMFKLKVEDIIENALLGDQYDELVDNMIVSL